MCYDHFKIVRGQNHALQVFSKRRAACFANPEAFFDFLALETPRRDLVFAVRSTL